jgi:hypothetical protein
MDDVAVTSDILKYTHLEHASEFNVLFGLPSDTKKNWTFADLIEEMGEDAKNLAHCNLVLSRTYAIKEPGLHSQNPNHTVNRRKDNVVREVYDCRDENSHIMLGQYDLDTHKADLSPASAEAHESYISLAMVGRGMWDYPTIPSQHQGRRGRFTEDWSNDELRTHFDKHFGFDLDEFKENSLPTSILRVFIPSKIGKEKGRILSQGPPSFGGQRWRGSETTAYPKAKRSRPKVGSYH